MKHKKTFLLVSVVIMLPLIVAFVFLPKAYLRSTPICHTTFSSLDYTSIKYQEEVVKILESKQPEDFRYFFKSFVEEQGSIYMIVNFRNETQCFDSKMKVDTWNKLAGMKRTNGASYPNELYDLKWKIVKTKKSNQLMYVDMHSIID